MDGNALSVIAASATVIITAVVHIGISAYQNGKRDARLSSLQHELTEHKGYSVTRAHGNGGFESRKR